MVYYGGSRSQHIKSIHCYAWLASRVHEHQQYIESPGKYQAHQIQQQR